MKNNRGFTLVELAVVLVVVGLLIGGVLKAQEMAEAGRVTDTIARAKAIDTAMRNFRTIYGAIPGDMKNAATRLADCNENCNPHAAAAGDELVGDTALAYFKTHQVSLFHPPGNQNAESLLFWQHLAKANLISGIDDRMLYETGVASQFGASHPAAKTGGGFVISSGSRDPGGMVPGSTKMFPYELIITLKASDDIDGAQNPTKDRQPMTARTAAQIDRKMDDGNPATGDVKGFGHLATCFQEESAGIYRYDQSVATKDCSVIIRIQK